MVLRGARAQKACNDEPIYVLDEVETGHTDFQSGRRNSFPPEFEYKAHVTAICGTMCSIRETALVV